MSHMCAFALFVFEATVVGEGKWLVGLGPSLYVIDESHARLLISV